MLEEINLKNLFATLKRKIRRVAGLFKKPSAVNCAMNVKELIKQYLPINPVVIEAGAHIGTDTVEFSKIWPKGSIYAFEPIR